ncbi:unnamed protein product [Peronospora belbahrii]|uniref:S-adenosyl-L-methionine-dependent methyltransferase n=1 Tax=Peronospora belbahrii TaxID=622444 RepID=A0AAU9KYD0_9STRA|nr:unnamed protein product [Peronospora belbahrii]
MKPASFSLPLVQEEEDPVADDLDAEWMGFVTPYLRGVESARNDRIVDDPFAEPLTRKQQPKIQTFVNEGLRKLYLYPENAIALRTRYLDEALHHRNPRILQIVILGAGLDARAYRLGSLRGCHVLEVDQSSAMFEHKASVMKELHAPLVAQNVDCIVSDLAKAGLEANLMGHGFNPTMPTFWAMEGLIACMNRPSIVKLLKTIDYLSAPGSEFWADMPGQTFVDEQEWGGTCNEASLKTAGEHFGRHWTPILTPQTIQAAPVYFVVGKKPIPDAVVVQKMCPGLDFED